MRKYFILIILIIEIISLIKSKPHIQQYDRSEINFDNKVSSNNEDNSVTQSTEISTESTRSNVPGEPLTPEEFQKASQLTKPKGTIDPNDPTNEDITDSNKQSNKGTRQKDVVEQWSNGKIPYVIDSDFDDDQRVDIAKAVQEFEDETCIKFIAADLEKDEDYVFIENSDDGCKSPIGHKGGRQTIRLADNCFDQFGRLLHEMMHTIGFVHEQSRTDRDKYVFVDYETIKEEYEHNFEKRDPPAGNYAGEYDTRSVLHYSASAFADPKNEITIFPYFDESENLGQRDGFSKKDIEKMNKWYKCKPKRQTREKSLSNLCTEDKVKDCKDLHKNCPSWARKDYCFAGVSEGWMTINCRVSCQKCHEMCKDLNPKCERWAKEGFCEDYDDFMLPYCPASCKKVLNIKKTAIYNKPSVFIQPKPNKLI